MAVMAIGLDAKLDDIQNLDYAYAPPFSTAIHPFAVAVNALLNKIDGNLVSITPREYAQGKAEGYKIIDASLAPSIKGAPYVDIAKVHGELPEIDKGEKLLLVCDKGKRAYMLQQGLKFWIYKYIST